MERFNNSSVLEAFQATIFISKVIISHLSSYLKDKSSQIQWSLAHYFIWWWLRRCALTWLNWVKRFPHTEQPKGFSPVWIRSCSFRWLFWLNPLMQNLQRKGLVFWCTIIWFFQFARCLKSLSQIWQWKVSVTLLWLSMCDSRSVMSVKRVPQSGHGWTSSFIPFTQPLLTLWFITTLELKWPDVSWASQGTRLIAISFIFGGKRWGTSWVSLFFVEEELHAEVSLRSWGSSSCRTALSSSFTWITEDSEVRCSFLDFLCSTAGPCGGLVWASNEKSVTGLVPAQIHLFYSKATTIICPQWA